ncbi:aminotransferase [Belnapia rosea]|uniref:aspartate transaminase n=1 Tax=Belnapia rosea TaxID=938405 RepID=A0A1G6NW02_9PROT|nr:aminotransferase [Belnapia rosea]SDC71437.1 Aspartate/methionine/tyrosine aminotransferase [Belnapia rosea]
MSTPAPLALSPRIQATSAPAIPTVRGWAGRYAGAAGPLIDLTQAVPGYPPHPALLERLAALAGDRATSGYGPIDGDLPLREALAEDMAGFYGAPFTAADIAITAGCNLAFAMTMAVLGGPVILPVPWYFNHRMALEMAGIPAIPLPCRAEDGFVPTAAGIEAALRAGGRVLVLVTPNNPTGAVYPAALIAEAAALCRHHGAWLVLDETYRDFLPAESSPPHALFQDPSWRDGLVHLYSFSKAYCVPGHRVGAIACGPRFREALLKALDTQQICAPRAAQAALAWAVPALRDWRAGNRAIMAERGAAFRQVAAQLPGWRLDALGAYFAYLRVPQDGPEAMAAAEALATERGLLGLPGPFFGPGQERHLRLAFANVELPAIAAIPAKLG